MITTLWPWDHQLSAAVTSESVSDEAIMQTMARCWEENQSLLCPHTAVAVSYHYQQMLRQTPRYGRGHLSHWARVGGQDFQGPSSSLSREHRNVNKWLK